MNAVSCAIYCIANSDFGKTLFFFSLGTAIFAVAYITAKNAIRKVRIYLFANAFVAINLPVIYFSMSCDMLWFMKYYLVYAFAFLSILLTFPEAYKLYLKKRYGFRLDEDLALRHGLKRIYVLDTLMPKAFTVGRDVFISEGLLDLLEEDEVSAVIYHEKFHAMQNGPFPLRAVKFLTFLHIAEEELERAADEYAERMVGREALVRAKKKLENFYS